MLVLSIITYNKIGRKESSACVCGFYSVYLFAASVVINCSPQLLRLLLRGGPMSDTAIVSAFLSGCPSLSYDGNKALFLLVQTFILYSNRFHITE